MAFHRIGNLDGRETVDCAFMALPALLVRHIVGNLALVKDDLSVFPFPYRLVFLEMFHHQRINPHTITGYHYTVCRPVLIPAYARAMIGSPHPEVIACNVALAQLHAAFHVRAILFGTAHPEKQVCQQGPGMIAVFPGVLPLRAHFQQILRLSGARVEENTRKRHLRVTCHLHTRIALHGTQGCKAAAQHYGSLPFYQNRGRQLINPRCQE